MTKKQILAFGMLGFSKDLLLCFSGGLLMLYLTDSLQLATTLVGGILFFNRFFDAFSDVLAAYLLEKFSEYLKKCYLIGIISSLIVFMALFSVNSYMPKPLIVVAVCVLYFILDIFYTMMDVSYWSLLPRFSTDDDTRAHLSSVATFFSSFAALICFTSALPLLHLFGGNRGFSSLTLVIAFLVASFVLLAYPHLPNLQPRAIVSKSVSPKEIFQVLLSNKLFFAYALYFFFFQLSFEWMNAYNIYYFKYSINREYFYSIYAFTILAQLFGAGFYLKLNQYLSKQGIFYLSAALSVLGMSGLFALGQILPSNIPLLFLFASIKQIGSGLFMVTATHDLSLVIEVNESETGKNFPAILTAGKLLLAKLSTSVTALGSGFGLHLAGYVSNQEQTPHTAFLISLQTFGVPIVFIIISLACYSAFKRLYQHDKNKPTKMDLFSESYEKFLG
ncbi:MFS transporter [Streptococcus halotolerans]|uniref:MFS transporter n=1 Tax=Streptococcus halotolerans TaxID=1814128 RepID=UPI000788A792|nr:MFS transporter [Streptococcus halotolerans]